MREWVSINGELTTPDQARVSVFDSGFMQGIGLFETMRAYEGRVFRLDQHLARLVESARRLEWLTIPSAEVLRHAVEQVVGPQEQLDLRVRLTVTTGTLRGLGGGDGDQPQLTVVASSTPTQQYAPDTYRKGVTAILSAYRQNPDDPTTAHKVTSYYARLAALRAAVTRGAFEAIWLTTDDLLAEGCISTLFTVRDGALLTPSLDTPVLPGITRAAVLELARTTNIPVREQQLELDDLRRADEAFLTNSMIQIVPLVRLDREPIGAEKPGEITARLFDLYQGLVDRECGDA